MTVCVGALCLKKGETAYVCASDLLVSVDNQSLSAAHEAHHAKTSFLGPRWLMSFSGDVSCDIEVQARTSSALEGNDAPTATEVMQAVEAAYRDARRRRIDGILSIYSIDEDAFLRKGRKWFGIQKFSEIWYQIENCWPNTFLVGGYNKGGTDGHVFTVSSQGAAFQDHVGFAAIGSGFAAATTMLYETYKSRLSLPAAIARVLEAKFLAERSPFVGEKTIVNIVTSNGEHAVLLPDDLAPIRKMWSRRGEEYEGEAAHTIVEALKKSPIVELGGEILAMDDLG